MCSEKTNGPPARTDGIVTARNEANGNSMSERSQLINPASLPAERCVLGALIEDDSFAAGIFASGLHCEDFFLSDHRHIFHAIELLYARNAPIDYVSVAEQLGNRNEDYATIADLIHGVVLHKDHILHHVNIVRRKARLRALLKIGEWISETVTETADPDMIAAQVKNMLEACSEDQIRA